MMQESQVKNTEISDSSNSLVLTPVETAKLLRIGRATVYEQIRLGAIPSIRMGRRILVPRAALMRKLEQAGNGGG
jgi:excisionase family DNA binding protein